MMEPRDLLRLTIGPLHYEFRAHDAWGEDALARLRVHVTCVPFEGAADRVFHLHEFTITRADNAALYAGHLPDRMVAPLPEGSPRHGWALIGDETGHLVGWHAETPHGLWTYHRSPTNFPAPFQLPWSAMLQDITAMNGGIVHGGLALWRAGGCVFLAPPGGGKTTALSRVSQPWEVLTDDAILAWPDGAGRFLASPLPTWSVLLGRGKGLAALRQWQINRVVPIAAILLLRKRPDDRLTPLPPIAAVQSLYQALCEHPRVADNRAPYRIKLFHVACRLAQRESCWELELTSDGRFWILLQEMLVGANRNSPATV